MIRLLDIFIHLTYKFGADVAINKLLAEVSLPLFWASEVCIMFIFLGYIIFSEFVRILGKDKVIKIIFG